MELLSYEFMIRALIAAAVIGISAPCVGIYLVQRRLALLGDGIGHIALTGVAAGFLLGISPLWAAVTAAIGGGVLVELLRSARRTGADTALAILFYGGIAGGVILLGFSDASSITLMSYLFGSLLTTSVSELWVIVLLAAGVVGVTLLLRPWLFAVCHDETYARTLGLPVRTLNVLITVTAAITVTVGMRVVGVLLISALMVLPVAAAGKVARGFTATLLLGSALGVSVALGGASASYYLDTPPGATIVIAAIGVFAVASVLSGVWQWMRSQRSRSAI